MNILILNGSPRKNGNTSFAVEEMKKVFESEGFSVSVEQVCDKPISGCVACLSCMKTGKCAIDDDVNRVAALFEKADGVILASPVYFASANGAFTAFLDRLFYSTRFDKRMKVGASVAVARRSGTTATFDQLNKYFTISGMPIASSFYWNNVHGRAKGEAAKDGEGMQSLRALAKNAAYLIKAINAYKEKVPLPEEEQRIRTNFIR